jgi:hypothetical protein
MATQTESGAPIVAAGIGKNASKWRSGGVTISTSCAKGQTSFRFRNGWQTERHISGGQVVGEVNPEARLMITRVLGKEPEQVTNANGTLSLHLGYAVITAEAALWSDPSAFQHADRTLTVSWGGQPLRISPDN